MRLPDVIIIGAMKSATSTLHDQLAQQPGVFMSTPKEPCFFSDDAQWNRGVDWYASLFDAAPPNALCGESSTHYTKLPTHPRTIERMQRVLPEHVKFIYIMRHPIERLVSHYIHEWTQRVIASPIEQAIHEHPELIAYSRYSMQLEPYRQAFGESRVLPMFCERIAKRPQSELERVCRFIGYQGTPQWDEGLGRQNASNDRLRRSEVRDAIVNMPVLRTVRRRCVPKSVRNWVKGFWTMKQRPQLSESTIDRLTAIFDEDLARVGQWFGWELSCSRFKQVAAEQVPQWRTRAQVQAA